MIHLSVRTLSNTPSKRATLAKHARNAQSEHNPGTFRSSVISRSTASRDLLHYQAGVEWLYVWCVWCWIAQLASEPASVLCSARHMESQYSCSKTHATPRRIPGTSTRKHTVSLLVLFVLTAYFPTAVLFAREPSDISTTRYKRLARVHATSTTRVRSFSDNG